MRLWREKEKHKKRSICINLSMHVYRYQYKKKKKINIVPLLCVAGIAAALLFFQGHGELISKMKAEAELACYEELLEWYLPGVVYSAQGSQDATVLEMVLAHIFPLGEENVPVGEYATQVESDLSYETILAREAADENYVDDETGQLVLTGETPDVGQTAGVQGETADETASATGTGSAEVSGETANAGTQTPVSDAAPAVQEAAAGTSQKAVSYSREKLADFDYLIQNFYQVDNTTTITGSQLNVDTLLAKDLRLSHDASSPQILIYHTHSQEGYADSTAGDASTTVVGVGDYLAKILTEQYGMNVLHHKGEYDVGDRDHAYSRAGPALEQVLAENPGIEVVIDLHRDGVREDTRLVTSVGGTQMAQIMFFNGLSRTTSTGDIDYLYNPYITDNLAISFQMQLAAAEYYPGFTRRIYLKGYRYNMHYCPKTLLIEVGAQTNTVQEAMNAMVPLADILNKVLTSEQTH